MLMQFPRNFATAAFSAVVGSSAAQVCMQHTGLGVLPHPLDAADAEPTTPRHEVERTGEWEREREENRQTEAQRGTDMQIDRQAR